jgi:hypothetical protein
MTTLALLALAFAFTADTLEPCQPPDLDRVATRVESEFQLHERADGVLGVGMEDRMEDVGTFLQGETDEAPPSKAPASTRWLWSEGTGWMLIPVGMRVTTAAIGVDGSWVLEARDGERRLRATSTGACVGCAMGNAAGYFPAMEKAAELNDFLFCKGMDPPLERLSETATHLRYRYTSAAGRVHGGVALVPDGMGDVPFMEMVVSGLPEAVRDTVLEAFVGGGQ